MNTIIFVAHDNLEEALDPFVVSKRVNNCSQTVLINSIVF